MTIRMFTPAALAAMLALAACGGDRGAENAASNMTNAADNAQAAADNAMAAANAANAAAAASGLSRYVGKYPFDKVGGHSWNDDPAVVSAVTAAVGDAKVRQLVLEAEGPSSPIVEKDGRVLSWACEAHNCGPHNWTTMIDAVSGAAEICYVNEEAAPGKTRWFKGGKEEVRTAPCPKAE
ncbi:hypothetical protein GCM10007897_36290 [Sphingobium jiangsuense]|uniref:Lipoprotein n=1 Tax=Sphingobium jiangsuense TaxID=870476 RepID=A0A7W6BGP6_9SPHN|nr:hypothetical protein [Sphingobium jiangsuense]MBB3924696.1 hypothetical protein [Sphingobium jiangsuense]GLT02224.1 hypothetical protein GCM10007897_36290 [Sphingobium jiangsuense]